MTEYLRPWKLVTLAIGLGLLIVGGYYYRYSDWDTGISIIMALLTYLTAPWSAEVVFRRQWKKMPLAVFWWLATVDMSYYIYHSLLGNEMIRLENFFASTALYWLCGFIWIYRGSIKELAQLIRVGRSGITGTK